MQGLLGYHSSVAWLEKSSNCSTKVLKERWQRETSTPAHITHAWGASWRWGAAFLLDLTSLYWQWQLLFKLVECQEYYFTPSGIRCYPKLSSHKRMSYPKYVAIFGPRWWGVFAAKEELALTLSFKITQNSPCSRCVACIGPLGSVRHERQLARSSQASGLRGWRLVKAQRQVPPEQLAET